MSRRWNETQLYVRIGCLIEGGARGPVAVIALALIIGLLIIGGEIGRF